MKKNEKKNEKKKNIYICRSLSKKPYTPYTRYKIS